MDNIESNNVQNQPKPTKEKKPLTEEERKNLSHKRIFWGIMGLNIILIVLIAFEIIYVFVG